VFVPWIPLRGDAFGDTGGVKLFEEEANYRLSPRPLNLHSEEVVEDMSVDVGLDVIDGTESVVVRWWEWRGH